MNGMNCRKCVPRCATAGIEYRCIDLAHRILKRQTVPPPVFPSKTKKFATGGSRPPRAFRISWPSTPPIIAQTGLNSCLAPFDNDLRRKSGVSRVFSVTTEECYLMRSTGSSRKTCLLTSAVEIRVLAMERTSAAELVSLGSSWCMTSYCQSPAQISHKYRF